MSITELGSRKLKTLTEPRQKIQRLPYLHLAVGQRPGNHREQILLNFLIQIFKFYTLLQKVKTDRGLFRKNLEFSANTETSGEFSTSK